MRTVCTALVLASLGVALPAQALTIEFDYTYDTRGFFTDSFGAPIVERRARLEEAASFYSGFTDSLVAITPQVGDSWSVQITHPSLGGPRITLNNMQIAADTLRIYVGGSTSGSGALGFANTGFNLRASGSPAFVDAVTTRGQANAVGANASDYGTWGGMIWFNAANNWYFGSDVAGLASTHHDFLTTALHEIAHILGYGKADSWQARIDSNGYFTGAASVAAYGGPVPLDQHGVHWAEGVMSTYAGLPQETMMDPSTPRGVRQLPTVLDVAGFADIGWQVTPIPEPGAWVMLLAGLGLLGAKRVFRRTSSTL